MGQGSLPTKLWAWSCGHSFIPLSRWPTSGQILCIQTQNSAGCSFSSTHHFGFLFYFWFTEHLSCCWACFCLILLSVFMFCLSSISVWSREYVTKCKLPCMLAQEWLVSLQWSFSFSSSLSFSKELPISSAPLIKSKNQIVLKISSFFVTTMYS